jgi:hypothetical protein
MVAALIKEKNLYDTDRQLWILETVEQLKKQDFSALDLENLIEEVADLGREQRHKVESYLRQLLKHLLLYQYWQAERPYCEAGWKDEIDNFRSELEILLRSRTLHNYFLSIIAPTYLKARASAVKKTGLEIFPDHCPYSAENILDFNWLPSPAN